MGGKPRGPRADRSMEPWAHPPRGLVRLLTSPASTTHWERSDVNRPERLRGWLLTAFAVAVASGVARPARVTAQTAPPQPASNFVYGGRIDLPPLSYMDPQGRPQGFTIDLVRALAREAGVTARFRLMSYTETRTQLDSGDIDLIGLGYTKDRTADYEYFSQLAMLHRVVLLAPGRSPDIQGVEQLGDETLVLTENSGLHTRLRLAPPERRPALVFNSSWRQSLQLLARGEVTAVAGFERTLEYTTAQLGMTGLRKVPTDVIAYHLVSLKIGRASCRERV